MMFLQWTFRGSGCGVQDLSLRWGARRCRRGRWGGDAASAFKFPKQHGRLCLSLPGARRGLASRRCRVRTPIRPAVL